MHTITIANLDIVFGPSPPQALALMDQGVDRKQIKNQTSNTIALQGVNLFVDQGEIFVIMGESEAGKSTLLRAINGLISLTRGAVNICVHNPQPKHFSIAGAEPKLLRLIRTQYISMVLQKSALFQWKNILENVSLGLEIAGVKKSEREQRAYETLKLLGLSDYYLHYPKDLSSSMQQRVNLARALATNAPILLMDEPFFSLEPLLKCQLQQELLHMKKYLKKTIIFVTNDLSEAFKIASRIAIMHEGKMIQVDRPQELLSHPKNKYVREFLQHADHTQLLRAHTIMTNMNELQTNSDHSAVFLDDGGTFRCLLDNQGRPRRSICGDIEGRIIPWTLFQCGTFSENDIILGHEYLSIKELISAMGRTKRPMIIQDKSGKMIGAITSDSIIRALANK
ncbi:MAG: ATP-binding cassette domain-containing protein [Myxococcales bacterium]|nr:ATP-binding cassette domain-containing protein [Myxococcales bacterium]USN51635.1 MAG: ATP-binding cassette domain-containing protein [Myxococcales bacterium]